MSLSLYIYIFKYRHINMYQLFYIVCTPKSFTRFMDCAQFPTVHQICSHVVPKCRPNYARRCKCATEQNRNGSQMECNGAQMESTGSQDVATSSLSEAMGRTKMDHPHMAHQLTAPALPKVPFTASPIIKIPILEFVNYFM